MPWLNFDSYLDPQSTYDIIGEPAAFPGHLRRCDTTLKQMQVPPFLGEATITE